MNNFMPALTNLDKIDKFLQIHELPKQTQEGGGNLSKDTESLLKNFKRSPGWDSFPGEFYQIFKEELTPVFIRLFQKTQGTFPNTFYGTALPLFQN